MIVRLPKTALRGKRVGKFYFTKLMPRFLSEFLLFVFESYKLLTNFSLPLYSSLSFLFPPPCQRSLFFPCVFRELSVTAVITFFFLVSVFSFLFFTVVLFQFGFSTQRGRRSVFCQTSLPLLLREDCSSLPLRNPFASRCH